MRSADEADFFARYGNWATVTPIDAAEILTDLAAPWWVAGGWAIDAFTKTSRHHDDIDISLFRNDVDRLRDAVSGRFELSSAGPEGVHTLTVEDCAPPRADQVWLRADTRSPWLLDVLLTPGEGGVWINRRHPSVRLPLSEATWVSDSGIRYLRPEYVLCFKAKYQRPKDDADAARAWPLMSSSAREVLREYLSQHYPMHRWLAL